MFLNLSALFLFVLLFEERVSWGFFIVLLHPGVQFSPCFYKSMCLDNVSFLKMRNLHDTLSSVEKSIHFSDCCTYDIFKWPFQIIGSFFEKSSIQMIFIVIMNRALNCLSCYVLCVIDCGEDT